MWKNRDSFPQQEIINDLFFNYDEVKAVENLKIFQHYIKKKHNSRIHANVLIYKTYYLLRASKFDENYEQLSKEILTEIKEIHPIKDENLMAWLYFLYGEINLRKDHVEESLFYNLKAEEIFEKPPDAAFPEKSNIYHSLTRALFFSREYDKAVEYGIKCEKALEKEGKMISDTRVYNCDFMFTSLMNLNRVDEAQKYVGELKKVIDAYKFNSERINEIWRGVYYNYSGQVLMRKGNYPEALNNFFKGLELVQKNNDKSNIISLKTNIGSIYFQEKNYTEAEKEWLEALAMSEEYIRENMQDRKQTIKILSLLSDFYSKQGNYKEALKYATEYNKHKDILEKQVQNASIRIAQVKLKNESLENDIELYQKDLKDERYIRFVSIFAGALILFILLNILITSRKRNKLLLEIKEKEKLIVQEDLANAEKNILDFKRLVTSKNSIIKELSMLIPETVSEENTNRLSKYTILTDKDWEEFRIDFSKTHPMFFSTLKNIAPDITPAMLRLSALVFLGLDKDEIAGTLGIDKDSVTRSIRRLRNTLEIDKNENIRMWLESVYKTE